MQYNRISPAFAVSEQICSRDLADIKSDGFRAIICNRPDGESADQPKFQEICAAAKTAGLEALYVPVQSGMITNQDVADFSAALKMLPSPVLAYCRSGTRSANLWSLHEANKQPDP